jgi:hypothetical protein
MAQSVKVQIWYGVMTAKCHMEYRVLVSHPKLLFYQIYMMNYPNVNKRPNLS